VPVADILNPDYAKARKTKIKIKKLLWNKFQLIKGFVPELERRTERPADLCLEVSMDPKTKLYSAYALVCI
jgi:hypothetical protein